MKRNHTIARFLIVPRKDCGLVPGPLVRSAPRDREHPAAWSMISRWRTRLLTAIKGALETFIARVSYNGLLAAFRLLPPDCPILAVLANLSGWGVL